MVSRDEFIKKLNEGKVLLYECNECGNLQLATVVLCSKCGSKRLKVVESNGEGRVVTFTILHVPPEGFEKYAPYGWAVVKLDEGINISGFIDVKSPKDIPLDSRVKVSGYDERGIVIKLIDRIDRKDDMIT